MIYELKGKLGLKTQAICIAEDNGRLQLYAGPKQTEELPLAALVPSKHGRDAMSPAGRAFAAIGDARGGRFRAKWDLDMLGELAWTWANRSAGDLRSLANEALEFKWHDLYASLPLTPSERAWRAAHDASSRGDLPSLLSQLRELPPSGYANRCGLVAPHLSAILAGGSTEWVELLKSWDASLPGVHALKTSFDDRDADLAALSSAQRELLAWVPEADRPNWDAAIQAVPSGELPVAPHHPAPEWNTYRWYLTDGQADGEVEPSRLGLAMVDDLVDDGRVAGSEGLGSFTEEQRWYVAARTAPQSLSHEQLRAIGHHGELARRLFIDRDMSGLRGLPPDQDVEHYVALTQLVDGGEPVESLRPGSRAIIDVIASSRSAIESGETREIPDQLAADPTTWVTFRELALAGQIDSSPEQRLRFPKFGNWIDLHRVLHLLWAGMWSDADGLARSVAGTVSDEAMQDEVLSLRAFALYELGRPADALSCLESAMAGTYTEALLVNTGIIARDADPALATNYFTRLINEAPTVELQVSAMRSAVNVWRESPDLDLPPETSDALLKLLGKDLQPEVYLDFIRTAARFDSKRLVKKPPPRPKSDPNMTVHDFFMVRAGLSGGDKVASDVAEKLVQLGPRLKGNDWFDAELSDFTGAIWDALTVDFGDGLGSALAAEVFVRRGPTLLTRAQYYFFALQSGAHQATHWRKNNLNRLNDEARHVFFFRPIEEFRVERKDLPSGLVDILADCFGLCLRVFLANDFDAARGLSNVVANEYNALAQRLGWDSENRYRIKKRMLEILDLDQQMIDELRRVEERCRQFPHNDADHALLGDLSKELANWQSEIVRLRTRF